MYPEQGARPFFDANGTESMTDASARRLRSTTDKPLLAARHADRWF